MNAFIHRHQQFPAGRSLSPVSLLAFFFFLSWLLRLLYAASPALAFGSLCVRVLVVFVVVV